MNTSTTASAAHALPSAANAALTLANSFCLIAGTTAWQHAQWAALLTTLAATGKPVTDITLGEVTEAICAQSAKAGAA